jgi:nucleotide-binding universal stress UspA family protein
MKILLPLDFSENSKKALDFIVSLSTPEVTKITLIHVVELVYDFASQAAVALDTLHREAESMFKKTIEKYQSTGIKFDYLILEGTASITIARTALELKSDLIVMGTQGASGIKKAFMGSTTVHTIKEAKTPVLVIPAESNIAKLKKITLALEIADHEQMHIDWVKRLSESWKLDLEFLHIQTSSNFQENLLILGLEAHLSKNYPNYPVKVRSYFAPNPKEGFDQYLQENNDSILVMCHEHKGLLDQILSKSQSIQMAYHTKMPLLVIT